MCRELAVDETAVVRGPLHTSRGPTARWAQQLPEERGTQACGFIAAVSR